MNRQFEIVRLAWADMRHDALVSLCQLILVMAVAAPLLLLFALKNGVATGLIEELERDPETLRLRPVGSYRLGPDFFAALAERPQRGSSSPPPGRSRRRSICGGRRMRAARCWPMRR
jgi:hypothetical protein